MRIFKHYTMVVILFKCVKYILIYLIILYVFITNHDYSIFPLQLRYRFSILVNVSTIMRLNHIVSLRVL